MFELNYYFELNLIEFLDVKFQSFNADRLAFKHTPKVKYQKKNSKKNETHYQMLKNLQFSEAQQLELINFCKKKKLSFYQHHLMLRMQNFYQNIK